MNQFEKAMAAILGESTLAKIQRLKIGIAGAGGLGSNCARFLVGSGFKIFKIVDFDRVEYSNLNRQFYFAHQVGRLKVESLEENLLQINPELEIEVLPLKIEQKNVACMFEDCDAVVEALDRPEDKRLVVDTYLDSGKLVVAASGLAGWGRIDRIATRQLGKNLFIVGDLISEVTVDCPPLAPGVNAAAAKQADVVLSFFFGDSLH